MMLQVSIHTPTQGVTFLDKVIISYFKVSIHTPTQGVTYIRKYNAECSGEKRQDGFRAALERLGISPAQQHEILHLSADSPRVLEAALKEIERSNGRIRSPLCFLRSRLTSVRTA